VGYTVKVVSGIPMLVSIRGSSAGPKASSSPRGEAAAKTLEAPAELEQGKLEGVTLPPFAAAGTGLSQVGDSEHLLPPVEAKTYRLDASPPRDSLAVEGSHTSAADFRDIVTLSSATLEQQQQQQSERPNLGGEPSSLLESRAEAEFVVTPREAGAGANEGMFLLNSMSAAAAAAAEGETGSVVSFTPSEITMEELSPDEIYLVQVMSKTLENLEAEVSILRAGALTAAASLSDLTLQLDAAHACIEELTARVSTSESHAAELNVQMESAAASLAAHAEVSEALAASLSEREKLELAHHTQVAGLRAGKRRAEEVVTEALALAQAAKDGEARLALQLRNATSENARLYRELSREKAHKAGATRRSSASTAGGDSTGMAVGAPSLANLATREILSHSSAAAAAAHPSSSSSALRQRHEEANEELLYVNGEGEEEEGPTAQNSELPYSNFPSSSSLTRRSSNSPSTQSPSASAAHLAARAANVAASVAATAAAAARVSPTNRSSTTRVKAAAAAGSAPTPSRSPTGGDTVTDARARAAAFNASIVSPPLVSRASSVMSPRALAQLASPKRSGGAGGKAVLPSTASALAAADALARAAQLSDPTQVRSSSAARAERAVVSALRSSPSAAGATRASAALRPTPPPSTATPSTRGFTAGTIKTLANSNINAAFIGALRK